MKTIVFAEPALVGREQELANLMHHLALVLEGKGTTIFVSGEAGSGKTKLTAEFLRKAKEKGVTILSGWCLSDAAVPYLPFVEAFDAYFLTRIEATPVASQTLAVSGVTTKTEHVRIEDFGITTWLTGFKPKEKPGKSGGISPQVWKDQLFSAVIQTLHLISTKKPVVLFLEDIHWADSASLALIHYVSRFIASEKILVLATFRSEELTADEDGHPHPLSEAMRLMLREELFTEIKLSTLSQENVSLIVENLVGGKVQAELVEKLTRESRGNALFLVESLRMLIERKGVVQENNQWRLASYDFGIPSKVKDIILRRTGLLKNDQRRVLDAASVIGEKFDVELLSVVLGQDSLNVLETLNVISRSTSLVSVEGNFYRFDHAKTRETLYSEIPSLLRSGYHTRVAEKLESTRKNSNLSQSDLSYHYAQAGNIEKASKYALAAANDELARFSNTEAAKHFKYVVENAPNSMEFSNEKLSALEGLGDALYALSFLGEAAKAFDQVINNSKSATVKLRAQKKAMLCEYWLGNVQGALEIAEKAEGFAQKDRLEYARLRLHRGFITGRAGKNDAALEDMEKALEVFEEHFSLPDVAEALVELAFVYRSVGRPIDSLSAALRSVSLYNELEDQRGLGLAYSRLAGPYIELGLTQNAFENLDKAIKIEDKVGDYNLLALHYWAMANTHEQLRDFEAAVAHNLKGITYAEKTDAYYVLSLCYASLIGEYSLLGKIELAEEYEGKIERLLSDIPGLKNNRNVVGAMRGSQGLLLAANGNFKESREILEELLLNNFVQTPMVEAKMKIGLSHLLKAEGRIEDSNKYREQATRTRARILGELEHACLQAELMLPREVDTGEEFNIRLEFVNATKNHVTLMRIEQLLPAEFEVVSFPTDGIFQNSSLVFDSKIIKPFSVEPVKFTLKVSKPGSFSFTPYVIYSDESGETKSLNLNPMTITARHTLQIEVGEKVLTAPILEERLSTGFIDLDYLLLGGIPKNYAVMLTSPSIDERELIIKRFLEAGVKKGETTFYITTEPNNGKTLAKLYPSIFYLFILNPQAETIIQNAPNIYKLKGVENLTEIDIALTKAFRTLNPSVNGKRACIEIVSDVLLQHHGIIARKWLNGLLPTFKSMGFTILAVINPQMHLPEEVQAILSLFEGEIRVVEKETMQGTEKTLKIRKLYNQKYIDSELGLSREKLESSS